MFIFAPHTEPTTEVPSVEAQAFVLKSELTLCCLSLYPCGCSKDFSTQKVLCCSLDVVDNDIAAMLSLVPARIVVALGVVDNDIAAIMYPAPTCGGSLDVLKSYIIISFLLLP